MENLKRKMAYGEVKNTLRFRWMKKDVPLMERKIFTKSFLMEFLKIKVEDIFCLQDNPRERGYDVTFFTEQTTQCVFVRWWEEQDKEAVKDFEVLYMSSKNDKQIIVHMYDPHVTVQEIGAFLMRYASSIGKPTRKIVDDMGIWTGKIDFMRVTLKRDPEGFDGFAHPPAFFNIGKVRGHLFYRGQPSFCKKCRGSGHRAGECMDGPAPKACHSCRSTDHLLKDCPERGRAGGGGPGRGAAGTGAPGPGGGQNVPGKSGGKEAKPKATTEKDGLKGGARKGSQAFNGAGVSSPSAGKKFRTMENVEEEMDSLASGEEWTVGGVEGGRVEVLGYDTGQPSCLFAPPSPAPSGEMSPERVEEGRRGKPPEEDLYD